MTDRRGMALLAALWFVVAIATVGLVLGLETREHRTIGQAAADHRAVEAAAVGALAIAQARLEQAIGQPKTPKNAAELAAMMQGLEPDPWLDVDSLLPDTLHLGNFVVHLHAEDLQAKLDVTTAPVDQLRTFLSFVLHDYGTADALAQAIADWRDRDDLPQPRGAERDDYIAHRRLDLPTNRGGFRDLEELRAVQGMTPEIFDRIRPYLRVYGDPAISIHTAPAAVLHAIPGMTEAMITQILATRSQHQHVRLASLQSVPALRGRIRQVVAFRTEEIELTVTVVPPPPAPVVQKVWMISKGGGRGGRASVEWADFADR